MGRRNRDREPSDRDGDRSRVRPQADGGGAGGGRAWYDRPATDRRSLGAPVVPSGRAWYDPPPLGPERGAPDWATPPKGADAVSSDGSSVASSGGPSPGWPDERPLDGSVEGWLGPEEPAPVWHDDPAPGSAAPADEPRGEAQSPGSVRFFTSGDNPQVPAGPPPGTGGDRPEGDWPAGRSWGDEPPGARRRPSPEDLASAAGRVWAEAHAADRRPPDEPADPRPRGSRMREDLLGATGPIRGEHIPPGGRRPGGPGGPGPGGGAWQGSLGGWQHGLDDSRLLRRMVVSPLDPPFSRTGEFEAVPTAGSGRLPPPPVEPPPGRPGRRTGPNRSVTAVPPLSPEEEARRAMRPTHAPTGEHRRDSWSGVQARVDLDDRDPWSGVQAQVQAQAQATVAPPHERDAGVHPGWRTVPPPFEPGADDADIDDHDAWRTVPPHERDAGSLHSWRTVPPPFEPGPDVEDHHGWRSGAPAFAPDVDARRRVPHARPTEVERRRDLRPMPHGPAIPVRPPSRAAAVLGVLAAIGFAWLVLVTLRQPTVPAPPIGAAGARIDEAVAQTLYADRVLSVLGWIANVATLLVLGGVIYRLFVAGPEPGQPGSKPAGARNARSPQAAPRATSSSAGLRVLRQAAVAGVAAELGSMLVRAVAMSGSGLAAAWDPDMLGFVVAVPFGDAALVRIAGLLLLAALAVPVESPVRQAWAQRRNGHHPNGSGYGANGRRPAPRPASERLALEKFACLLGGLVVLASFVLVGHPQATERAPLLAFAQCVHVVAVSTWFGGVTFLSIELRQQRREGTARVFAGAVARFSTVAGAAVALAGTTGLVLANSQLASPSALLDTPYGRALLVKLSVLAIPLLLGAYNRQRLVPAVVRRDEPAAWRHLRQTMTAEALLIALGILVATTAMTSGGFY